MFENAGGKIKTLAVVLFAFGIIGSIVCAIALGRTPDRWGEMHFNFLLFIAILAGGVLSGFISSLFLYAFGEMAENIQFIARSTDETAQAVKAAAKTAEQPAAAGTSAPAPGPRPVFSNRNASLSDTWVCQKCGTRNKQPNMYCKDCGEYK